MRSSGVSWSVIAIVSIVAVSVLPSLSLGQAQKSHSQFVGDATAPHVATPQVIVLGVAQDAGFPQAGCQKPCCQRAWQDPTLKRHPVTLAIVDPQTRQRWLLDCSPAFPEQWQMLNEIEPAEQAPGLDGILLTHAHIGHYLGLAHLGREVMGARGVRVYAMPRMREFLTENGPWGQLIELGNIQLRPLVDGQEIELNSRIHVTPILVPHRDEYSETVGFIVRGPNQKLLYLPDIDKWDRWDRSIRDMIGQVDVALLDGTFFAEGELPGRNMAEIPHPFIRESIGWFQDLPTKDKNKVRFIHFNHTNPVLDAGSAAARQVRQAGFHVAAQGERHSL